MMSLLGDVLRTSVMAYAVSHCLGGCGAASG